VAKVLPDVGLERVKRKDRMWRCVRRKKWKKKMRDCDGEDVRMIGWEM
jgi:hypothetical protein